MSNVDLPRLEELQAMPVSGTLTTSLQVSVPLRMQELEVFGEDSLLLEADTAQGTFQAHADVVLFGGTGAARGFAALTTLLAVGALLAEGGITFMGVHWCTTPGGLCCPKKES